MRRIVIWDVGEVLDFAELLTSEERGNLFLALLKYVETGDIDDGLVGGSNKPLFEHIRNGIDSDYNRFLARNEGKAVLLGI